MQWRQNWRRKDGVKGDVDWKKEALNKRTLLLSTND
jgi:hypothetical protein